MQKPHHQLLGGSTIRGEIASILQNGVSQLKKRAVDKIKARPYFVCKSGLKFHKIYLKSTRNILQNVRSIATRFDLDLSKIFYKINQNIRSNVLQNARSCPARVDLD
jgi:hypothetical protein